MNGWLRPVTLREVCPATNGAMACDRGVGHNGPHMTKESWQWFDAPSDDFTCACGDAHVDTCQSCGGIR